ncbi:pyridoxal phosphate-dependent aminotransferase [Verrucomicrobiota bacterium]
MRECQRMLDVQSPIIPVVGELIRENPGTISLGQGVVNYGPPQDALDHIGVFLSDPENHKYKLVQGIPELLTLVETKLAHENGIDVGDDLRVVVTAGGNMAFLNAALAITDPDDEIIFQVPYYFNHEMAVTMAGCKPVCVPTDENYQLQPDKIREAVTNRTRGVITISPNNPTGAVYPEEALREVNALCRELGIYHIHDEAYEYFMYEGTRHFSPGSIPEGRDHTISLFSMSKAFGFASWRIGWMVIPGHLFMSVRKIQDTNLICPPVISQWAAVGALTEGSAYCRHKVEALEKVRHMVLEKLSTIADIVTVPPALGAFYFLLRVNTDMEMMQVVERLVREHKIAVIPGSTFGIEDGCCLRIAYGALEEHTVADGMDRLVKGLLSICGG